MRTCIFAERASCITWPLFQHTGEEADDAETATLHVDLSHLAPNQNFTLRVGSRAYPLAAHTQETLERARQSNAALAVLPDARISHFTEAVQVPGNHPVMLRISAPSLRADDPLDRLLLTAIYIPRPLRAAGIAQRRAAGIPTSLRQVRCDKRSRRDARRRGTDRYRRYSRRPFDAAKSLVFHHPELLAFQGAAAEAILNIIDTVPGLFPLANSILSSPQAHESDPTQPNWVTSQPGQDWRTGQPTSKSIYVWSDETLENLALPLQNALRLTKDTPSLEGQCWSVQAGITQVPSSARRGTGHGPPMQRPVIPSRS